eukprot:860444-Prymnesium_polylepis.2
MVGARVAGARVEVEMEVEERAAVAMVVARVEVEKEVDLIASRLTFRFRSSEHTVEAGRA